MPKPKYQIFISSTFEDLKDERNRVIETILRLGHSPIGFEMFNPRDTAQSNIIQREISESDLFILIIGHRYGSINGKSKNLKSFTEMDFEFAQRANKKQALPILCFIQDRSAPVATNKVEQDPQSRNLLDAFITKVKSSGIAVDFWRNGDDLALKVSSAVNNTINKLKERLAANDPPSDTAPTLKSNARDTLLDIVPIIKNDTNDTEEFKVLPKVNVKNYLPFYKSEGNHKSTLDQLDFEYDIESLSSIIALKNITPPLAIGLFGKWGTGKSFFMQKLEDKVTELSTSDESKLYVKNVVQIKFSAWHYAESNLWASLITHIFDSLNDYATKRKFGEEHIKSLFANFNITNNHILETKEKIESNEKQIVRLKVHERELNEIIDEKKTDLNLWKKAELIKIVFSDPFIRSDFNKIVSEDGIKELIDNITEVDARVTELSSYWNRLAEGFNLLRSHSKGNWKIVWALFILMFLLVLVLASPLRIYLTGPVSRLITISSFLVISFSQIKLLRPYMKKVEYFYKRIKSLKETIDHEKRKVKLKEESVKIQIQAEILDLEKKREYYLQEISEKETLTVKLKSEISDIATGKRLSDFLAEKSRDENYTKQLGIISWIRKDFALLNELFIQQTYLQHDAAASEFKIDRIILYIDDLDRCDQQTVVKVLEAINLLLAYPLFVVVVGVDPRWLSNALNEEHSALFNPNPAQQEDPASLRISAYDYLEKIFQIPFALKPIDQNGKEKLITYLLSNEMIKKRLKTAYNSNEDEITKDAPQRGDFYGDEQQYQEYLKIRRPQEAARRTVFSEEELSYLKALAPLYANSPRTINRYINTYRIIKSHKSFAYGRVIREKEYMPVMFLLSIIVGKASFASEFLKKLRHSLSNEDLKTFLTKADIPENLIVQIIAVAGEKLLAMKVLVIRQNLELVSRFSFRSVFDQ